jgi:HSP20 family protein
MWPESWSPFFDVEKTLNEMDRIFNAVGRPLHLRSVPRGTFPAVNVYDRGAEAVLVAEMPGVRSEDVELTVVGDTITLQGRREESPGEEEQYYRRERPMGVFARTITLPVPVNPEKVKAEYHDGVLRVTMEKAEQAKTRKVEIKS